MTKLDFAPTDNPWLYRMFLLMAIALFVVPAWLGPTGAILADAANSPGLSGWLASWVKLDGWIVEPQVRLLTFVSPPLAEKWPVLGGLTDAHRTMFSVFYGVLAWICVRLVSHQYEGDWALRTWWLIIYGLVALGFFQVIALLFIKFGAIQV